MEPLVKPTMESLWEDICEVFKQDALHIRTTSSKNDDFVVCRRIFCYIAYVLVGYKTEDIARFLMYSDHSSICSHTKKIRHWMRLREASFMEEWETYQKSSKLYPVIKDIRYAA